MKRFVLLLLPSPIGGVVTLLVALLLVGFNAWSYIEYRQFFYDFLFGVGGLKTVLLQAPDHLTLLKRAVLGNGNSTYYALLVLVGILVATTIYTILNVLAHTKDTIQDAVLELHRPERAFHRAANEAFLRLGVRAASLAGWSLYWILWLNLFMPYCTLLLEDAMDAISANQPSGYLLACLSYALIAISLHLHLIFLRLCFLRPRLFGDSTAT